MEWISAALAVVALGLGALCVYLFVRNSVEKGRLQAELQEARDEIAVLNIALDLQSEPDPTLDELHEFAGRAVARAGGLSEAESRAMDRILRSRGTSQAGESDGR